MKKDLRKVYTHNGSGELDNNLNTRWFMEDGVSTTPSAIDSLLINGRAATLSNDIPLRNRKFKNNQSIDYGP